MKTYPLRTFVHRVLLVRLGTATIVIAAVVGLIAYTVQTAQIGREAVDLGRRGVSALQEKIRFENERQEEKIRDLMAGKKVDPVNVLREVVGRGTPTTVYRAGRFVYLQVYDRERNVLAEKSGFDQTGMESVKAFAAAQPLAFPAVGRDETVTKKIGGAWYVLVSTAVTNENGNVAAYARGVFAVAPAEVVRMRRAIIRSSLIAAAIVLAVSALLYPVILQLTRRLADYSNHLLDANLEALLVLGSAIAKRDSDTDAHNYRVTLYSTRMGEALGLPAADMRVLIKGAFLHDVGKLGIPDNILHKPAKLDQQEFTVMKTHVDKGADIVRPSSWLREGTSVVGYHHEKFAGGGYPHGLRGEDIPITARIFAVADVFDALTSQRPYKKPLSFEETMDILEQDRGKHFDPKVLDVFGTIARDLHDRYGGREGADLKDELTAVVTGYYSAGMETLSYGSNEEAREHP
jgi:HD-GYP domain-containing protein (c-di-GMP phosphodiesterase class II)